VRYLLVINTAGNVMLADVGNDIRMPIGAPLAANQRSRVSTAVWSAQGRWTAWSVDSTDLDGVREVRMHDEESDRASVLVQSVSAFYLCPSPCGRWLSHLSLGPLGLELAVSNVTTGEIHIVERGQPLFWSWSPDATQLAVHVENRVLISDSAGRSTRVLTDDAGPFVTPWWLPGGSVVYAVGDRIVAAGPDDAVTTLVARGSSGRFSLDPEGQRLAYIASTGSDGTLVVLDLLSLAPTEVTSAPVVAFFWSPDGRRLAALTATGDGLVQWLIVDGSDTLRLPPFRPTRSWAGSVLSFFEQYAQSHNVWSSDATALVASAIDDEGHSGALVHTIDSPDNTQWIPDAELVWWA
jgi:TolB protein